MGEAVYYLKARFVSPSERLKTEVTDFFTEGANAYDFWQMGQGNDHGKFWTAFKEEFPLIYKMLAAEGLADEENNNNLSGKLNFGDLSGIAENLTFHKEILYYSAEVWHYANWAPIANFLESEFGATAARWVSSEYVDHFDLLHV